MHHRSPLGPPLQPCVSEPPDSRLSPELNEASVQSSSEQPQPELRPLTSLRWPYVPEESAYPDPLRRDDPKPLQIPQYEAIGQPSHTVFHEDFIRAPEATSRASTLQARSKIATVFSFTVSQKWL